MITVVGSLNLDYIFSVDRRPRIGETIASKSLDILHGGKGGNQAVAAAKIGSKVSFVGSVGNDLNGLDYIKELEKYKINTDRIKQVDNHSTGVAFITIENDDNTIIISEGANGSLTEEDIESATELIKQSNVIIMQFEIPHKIIGKVIEIAKDTDTKVILNPAPFKNFPIEWLEKITYITPNEQEYKEIIKHNLFNPKFKEKFIITLGKKGAQIYDGCNDKIINAPNVTVKDTTGAGDTFNGVLAHYIEKNHSLENACEKAVYAASLSTTKIGTHKGIPTESELQKFMTENKKESIYD